MFGGVAGLNPHSCPIFENALDIFRAFYFLFFKNVLYCFYERNHRENSGFANKNSRTKRPSLTLLKRKKR